MLKQFAFVALTLLLVTASASAQSNTGRLSGVVSGPDGVISGATIVVKDNQTGADQTITSGAEGAFSLPNLQVGTYTVTITAPGFKTFTATEVKIDVGREYSLNPTLEVGNVSETVTVIGGADVVNSTNGELSNTVDVRRIRELPLNGRNPTSLILLQAGTASNGSTNTSINGQRPAFTNITRDGINIQDNFIRANASDFAVQNPNVDNVEEFTLTSQNAGAEQGYGASQVQFVTPRGQNDFHGALYEYNRNSKFAANNFFNNASGTPLPFLNRNQYGGRLSGPIFKNKLFFFGFYEAFRQRTQSPELRTILTPSARAGNFTFVNNAGQTQTVNLFTAFGGATGITGINPLVQSRLFANLPAVGNTTERGDQRNTTGYRFNQRNNLDLGNYATRIDYDINDSNRIHGIFTYGDERVVDRPDVDRGAGGGFSPTPVVNQPSNRKFFSSAYNFLRGSFTNELRGGFFLSDPFFYRTTEIPAFFIAPPLISNPEVTFLDQGRRSNTYSFSDNASYTFSNHSFRFGGIAQFFRINSVNAAGTVPTFTLGVNSATPQLTTANFTSLGGINPAQLNTANSLLALLGGVVSSGTQTFNVESQTSGFVPGAIQNRQFAYENIGLYFQDQYRVSPQLTLNLGLRYEIYTGLRSLNGLALEPVIPQGADPRQALLDPNGRFQFVGGNAGGNGRFFRNDKNNFGPTISFAYAPTFTNKFLGSLFPGEGKTVLRGGYRISYVNDEFVRAPDAFLLSNAGLSFANSALSTSGAFAGTSLLNLRLDSGGALPTAINAPTYLADRTFATNNGAQFGFFGTAAATDPNLQVTRNHEYSFGIQREIGFQTALEIRYVGAYGKNLVRGIDLNQIDIFNNGFLADYNRARANFLATGNAFSGPNQLTIFGAGANAALRVANGTAGAVSVATFNNALTNGTPADLARSFIGVGGSALTFPFRPNQGIGQALLLTNGARYNYNALQVELRRRLAQGFTFQTNYTFQKTLTDAVGTGQTRFDPFLDINQPRLEYSRADYDQTHVFNVNTIYELPFGRGKRFFSDANGLLDRVIGGFTFTTIIRSSTGAPITILDAPYVVGGTTITPRGTLNNSGRSGRQTAVSSLSKAQIKQLIGIFRTPNGVFFINPSAINPATGRGAEGFGTTPFSGQVFFNAAPGQTGNLERAFINGPFYFNMDASIIKNIPLTERVRFQIRAEAFNVLNRANFFASSFGTLNINDPNFGRVASTFSPRIVQFAGRIEF